MLKTSTEIASLSALVGERRAVEMIAKAGFDAWDFSLFDMCRWDWQSNRPKDLPHPLNGKEYLAFARELRHIGEECGIVCNQSHAPFPSAPMFEWLVRSIECTAEAGGKICIIHPVNTKSAEENAEMYERLLPYAKDAGIKIATENMWNWNAEKDEAAPAACSDPESFLAHLNAVNDPSFVACLDLGHAEMKGLHTSAPEMSAHSTSTFRLSTFTTTINGTIATRSPSRWIWILMRLQRHCAISTTKDISPLKPMLILTHIRRKTPSSA